MSAVTASPEQRVSVSAFLPAQLRDQLEALAREHDRSFSAELRRAVRHYVESGRAAA